MMSGLEASVPVRPFITPKLVTERSNTPEDLTFIEENIIEDSPTTSPSTVTCVSTSSIQKPCACLCRSNTCPPTSAGTIATPYSSPTITTTPKTTIESSTTLARTLLPTTFVLRNTSTNPTSTTIQSTTTSPSITTKPSATTSTSTSLSTTQMSQTTTKLITKSTLKTAATTASGRVINKSASNKTTSVTPIQTETNLTTKKTTVCINCQRPTTWETTSEKDLSYVFITTSENVTEATPQKTTAQIKTTIDNTPKITHKRINTQLKKNISVVKSTQQIITEEYLQNNVVNEEETLDPISDRGFISKEDYEDILTTATPTVTTWWYPTTSTAIPTTATWWYPTTCKFGDCERPLTWQTTTRRHRNNY